VLRFFLARTVGAGHPGLCKEGEMVKYVVAVALFFVLLVVGIYLERRA